MKFNISTADVQKMQYALANAEQDFIRRQTANVVEMTKCFGRDAVNFEEEMVKFEDLMDRHAKRRAYMRMKQRYEDLEAILKSKPWVWTIDQQKWVAQVTLYWRSIERKYEAEEREAAKIANAIALATVTAPTEGKGN